MWNRKLVIVYQIRRIPAGFFIHNIEMRPNSGGKLARSAGSSSAQIIAKDENFATLKMPSNRSSYVELGLLELLVGVLGNADYKNISWGRSRKNS